MLKLNLLARSRSDGVFRPITYFISVVLFFAAASPGWAATVEYTLTTEKTSVNLTGKPSSAMTINGSIPGPVLRFKKGDTARIHVQNAMAVETSIGRGPMPAWKGILTESQIWDLVNFIRNFGITRKGP